MLACASQINMHMCLLLSFICICINKGNKLLLDNTELEYPRANKTIREIYATLWQDYYECLRQSYAKINLEKTLYPSAIAALEGTSVTLKCEICVSPIEIHISDIITWYFNNSNGNIFNQNIEDIDHITVSLDNGDLVLYNVKQEQAGQYWCKMGDTLAAPYYLYIDNASDELNTISADDTSPTPDAELFSIVEEYNLKVYTTWSTWSPCSTCNIVGIKVRYGYCTLSLLEDTVHNYIASDDTTATTESHISDYTKKRYKENDMIKSMDKYGAYDESLNAKLKTVLLIFKNNLPCISTHLPKSIKDLPVIKNRRTKVVMRYCKTKCAHNLIFEVRDKQGNVLESANNSAGIYSMMQEMPKPLPPIVHMTIYKNHNQNVKLKCPGNLNTDAPIIWKIGNKILNPSIIRKESSGRIHINSQMYLIFKNLKFTDTNIYSCWQNNEPAGVIKLNITDEIELKVNKHAITIGGIFIIIVFLKVFWNAFKGRKRYTMH